MDVTETNSIILWINRFSLISHWEKLYLSTQSVNIIWNTSYLLTSQILLVVSSEEEATKSPQECHVHDHIAWVCPSKVKMQLPLDRSHNLTVVSPLEVANLLPLYARTWKGNFWKKSIYSSLIFINGCYILWITYVHLSKLFFIFNDISLCLTHYFIWIYTIWYFPIWFSKVSNCVDLNKTLMLGKIEGRRRRGLQRMRWLDGITNSMDMS